MTPPNQAAMEQAMELHTHDVSRVLVAEMVAASREMSDEADRTEALDELTTEANKLDAVHKALLAVRMEIGANPKADPWAIVSAHVNAVRSEWLQVEQRIVAEQGGAVCVECRAGQDHVELMVNSEDVGGGLKCVGCAGDDERAEGLESF